MSNNTEVPLFLRKTYSMIDTCDPNIACWADDGQSFIVKNTTVFEKQIIPQFFKHSKFSSFVRQLNFYSFRKIKNDAIRIDAKIEREKANFWRFRHEKFIRGRPDLLVEIKRSNGAQAAAATAGGGASKSTKTAAPKEQDSGALKSEVNVLKKRIEAMTKNIDDLTTLVQKVTLKPAVDAKMQDDDFMVGAKRKKVDLDMPMPDVMISGMGMDDDPLAIPSAANAFPPSMARLSAARRETSETSNATDHDFVDDLFTAFGDESLDDLLEEVPMPPTTTTSVDAAVDDNDEVDPRLMKKLGEALKVLPREMQEMIVDRLVAGIMSNDALEKNVSAATALSDATTTKVPMRPIPSGKVAPDQIPPSPVLGSASTNDSQQQQLPMSLAAATLSALLTQYTKAIKEQAQNSNTNNVAQKAMPPIVPVHA